MRAGRVVYIRVGPADCIAISYALEKIPGGMNPDLSFSHGVKLVLESCISALKRDGVLPNSSGFEYSERMRRFPIKEDARLAKAKQIKFTNFESHPSHVTEPITPEDPARRAKRVRYEELKFRKETDALNWSDEDQAEFTPLVEEFFI